SPRIVTRSFSPKAARPEEWLAFHDYMRLRAEEEDPGDPAIDDATRQRDMLIDWPLFEAHRILALIDDQIVGSLAMWTRRPGTPDYEAHARLITAGHRNGTRRRARRLHAFAWDHHRNPRRACWGGDFLPRVARRVGEAPYDRE